MTLPNENAPPVAEDKVRQDPTETGSAASIHANRWDARPFRWPLQGPAPKLRVTEGVARLAGAIKVGRPAGALPEA